MKTKERFLKYSGILLFMLIIMVYILGVIIPSEGMKVYQTQIDPCINGWFYTDTTIPVSELSLDIKAGKSISITRTLTSAPTIGEIFGFFDPGTHSSLYIDDRLVFEAGKDNDRMFGSEVGSIWRCIPISGCDQGSMLTLNIENLTSATKRINFNKMYMCEENNIFRIILVDSVLHILIYAITFVTGVLLLFLSYGLRRLQITQYSYRFLFLGGMSICIGSWILSESSLLQLIFNSSSIKFGLEYGMIIVIAYFAIMYYRELLYEIRTFMNMLLATFDFAVLIILLLNLLNVVNISNSITVVHIYLVIITALMFIFGLKQYLSNKSIENLGLILSTLVLVPTIAIGLMLYYSDKNNTVTSIIVGFGFILLLFVSMLTTGRSIVIQLNTQLSSK